MTNKEIYGTQNLDELVELFVADVRKRDAEAFKIYNKYLPAIYLGQALNSVAVRFSTFRKPLKKMGKNKVAKQLLEIMWFPEIASNFLKKQSEEKTLEKKENKSELDINFVFETLKNLKEKIISKNFITNTRQDAKQVEMYCLAIYIALNSGRRLSEVLKTFEIEKKGKNIIFKNLLKKKSDEMESFENMHLVDEDYLFTSKCLKRLREILDTTNMTNDQVAKKYSFIFNSYMKKHILLTDKYTFHDLRKMYAQACWVKFADKEQENQKDFFAKILGHEIQVDTVDHYLIFKGEKK